MKKIITLNGHELTFYHYKEPLTAIPKGKGFGYYGALLSNVDGTKLQCHICGDTTPSPGGHIWNVHHIKGKEYKERFGLAMSTSLMTETERLLSKQRFWDLLKTDPERFKKFTANWKDHKVFHKTRPGTKLSAETMNKRGTCPKQLLERILEVKKKLRHTPSLSEFIAETGTQRYKYLIFKVYGSWRNALHMLNLKAPTAAERRGSNRSKRYTEAELIEHMQLFVQENNALPTNTDFKRGLLPSEQTYRDRWGTIEAARQAADAYHFLEQHKTVEQQRVEKRKAIAYNR